MGHTLGTHSSSTLVLVRGVWSALSDKCLFIETAIRTGGVVALLYQGGVVGKDASPLLPADVQGIGAGALPVSGWVQVRGHIVDLAVADLQGVLDQSTVHSRKRERLCHSAYSCHH